MLVLVLVLLSFSPKPFSSRPSFTSSHFTSLTSPISPTDSRFRPVSLGFIGAFVRRRVALNGMVDGLLRPP